MKKCQAYQASHWGRVQILGLMVPPFQISILQICSNFPVKYSIIYIFPSLQTDQLMSEKLTGADHTKLDDQFTQMEKITDVFLEVEVGYYCQL